MRPIEQIKRALDDDSRSGISSMAPIGCESQGLIVRSWVAYSGAIAPEALQAVGLMAEARRDVGLLAITSADRLYAGWTAAQRARESGLVHSRSHIERLLAGRVPRRAPYEIPRHFGRTGSLVDLYRHYGIGAYAIVTAAQSLVTGRPIRHLRAL